MYNFIMVLIVSLLMLFCVPKASGSESEQTTYARTIITSSDVIAITEEFLAASQTHRLSLIGILVNESDSLSLDFQIITTSDLPHELQVPRVACRVNFEFLSSTDLSKGISYQNSPGTYKITFQPYTLLVDQMIFLVIHYEFITEPQSQCRNIRELIIPTRFTFTGNVISNNVIPISPDEFIQRLTQFKPVVEFFSEIPNGREVFPISSQSGIPFIKSFLQTQILESGINGDELIESLK